MKLGESWGSGSRARYLYDLKQQFIPAGLDTIRARLSLQIHFAGLQAGRLEHLDGRRLGWLRSVRILDLESSAQGFSQYEFLWHGSQRQERDRGFAAGGPSHPARTQGLAGLGVVVEPHSFARGAAIIIGIDVSPVKFLAVQTVYRKPACRSGFVWSFPCFLSLGFSGKLQDGL